jgi:hypothetical protein
MFRVLLSQIHYEAMQIVVGLGEGKLDECKPLKAAGGILPATERLVQVWELVGEAVSLEFSRV